MKKSLYVNPVLRVFAHMQIKHFAGHCKMTQLSELAQLVTFFLLMNKATSMLNC